MLALAEEDRDSLPPDILEPEIPAALLLHASDPMVRSHVVKKASEASVSYTPGLHTSTCCGGLGLSFSFRKPVYFSNLYMEQFALALRHV